MNRPTTELTYQSVRRGHALERGRLPDGELLTRPEHEREEGGDEGYLLPWTRGYEVRNSEGGKCRN